MEGIHCKYHAATEDKKVEIEVSVPKLPVKKDRHMESLSILLDLTYTIINTASALSFSTHPSHGKEKAFRSKRLSIIV